MEAEFKKLENIYSKIKFLIENNPQLSGDSDKLVFTYLFYELGSERVNEMSGYDVFSYFNSSTKDKTTKINSITRTLCLVLQQNPNLRFKHEEMTTAFKIKNND
jgi:hypothetical protein